MKGKSSNITDKLLTEEKLQNAIHELLLQNEIMERRVEELTIANKELAFQNREKQKKATKELDTAEIFFRALIENNYDIISLNDDDLKPIYRSPSLTRITGWTDKDMKNKAVSVNIHPDDLDTVKSALVVALKNPGKPHPYLCRYKHKNGHYIWLEGTATKLPQHEHLNGLVINSRDVTEQKIAEEKLAEKNEELKVLNRQKDKLFSVISHDLRNTVAGAKGVFDMILEDYEELSKDEISEYLHVLNQRTHNTHELLEDLLAWSKNQFQEVATDLEKLHLASLTDATLDNLRSQADSKDVELLNQIPDTIFVHADANMMKTVLRNLGTNGIKFSNPGGKIRINAERTNQEIKISVTDNGIGMDEETQKKVMNKQTNFTSQGTSGEKGSGVGLDLCIDFIEMQGGKIWVESEPGQGSTFNFTLPEYHKQKNV